MPMADKPQGFQFGGMAVLEGVMMRSPKFWSVAVRAPSGEILVKTEPIEKLWIFRQKWLMLPFLRGTLALLDTMLLGNRAMRFAGEIAADERFQPLEGSEEAAKKSPVKKSKFENWYDAQTPEKRKQIEKVMIGVTVVVSLALSVTIFDFGPEGLAQWTQSIFKFSNTWTNAVAETVKLAMFIGYLFLIRRIPAILDVFRYHGAEHAAINAMEKGQELTPDNCLANSRFHLRCGTNFAIMVVLVGFLVFIPLPRDLFVPEGAPAWVTLVTRILVRMAVLPVVAGISYEIIRAAGRAKDKRFLTYILTPGMWTQVITTEEPEAKHAEVAIESLRAVETAEAGGELMNSDVEAVANEAKLRREALAAAH
jgi:uncharacterized protein YqhQ